MIHCQECCQRKGQALGLLCAECADKLYAKVAALTNQIADVRRAVSKATITIGREGIEKALRAEVKP